MSKIDDILKLANLGYTKEEIDVLLTEQATPVVEPQKVAEPTKVEPVAEVKTEVSAPQTSQTSVTLTSEQLNQLVQGIAVKTASGTIEMPKTTDEILGEHFKSILKGE